MRFPSVGLAVSLLCLSVLLLARPARAEPPPAPERVVAILPFGSVSQDILDRVAQALQERLHVQVRFEPQRELPKAAWYAPRRRWRAEKLLEAIDADPPKGAWKVVAITEAEISTTKDDIPDWGIAGLGSLSGQSCVLSTRIYRKHSKTQAVLLRRMEDLAVHEFGHTLGFDHCETEGCVMSDAKGKAVSSADSSTGHYCARCLGLLSPEDRARMKVEAGKRVTPGPR
ncbi:archaemetzincin [Pyxidicoccus trucidator]|uniref:archaemetzincin n=1 Tax=Pyxidicoccus trucidator TaxID=2709662 RepID=UPI0013D9ABDE|nr:archaemetzincin [Pyxidicoccus trucidator]